MHGMARMLPTPPARAPTAQAAFRLMSYTSGVLVREVRD